MKTVIPFYYKDVIEEYKPTFRADGKVTKKSLNEMVEGEGYKWREWANGGLDEVFIIIEWCDGLVGAKENYEIDMEEVKEAVEMLPAYMIDTAMDYLREGYNPLDYWCEQVEAEIREVLKELREETA